MPRLTRTRQDLFSSIFLGTDRIVGYADFYPDQQLTIELEKLKLSGDLDIYLTTPEDRQLLIDYADTWLAHLPSGFVKSAHLLGPEFLKIAEDVAILYAGRQKLFALGEERLDNVQAQLEGRIHTLRLATSDHMLLCCILAIQLCVYGFWDGVWNAALIPRELSIKLLYHLRCCQLHYFEEKDLFFWVVYVGKAFAIDVWVRNGLDDLLLKRYCKAGEPTFPPWYDAKCILSKFIWSDVLHSEKSGWFWEKIGQ